MRTVEATITRQYMLHGSDGASRIYSLPERWLLAGERVSHVLVNGKRRGCMLPENAVAVEFGDNEPEPETVTVVIVGEAA